jgi:predicted enzyme related to lactoylglutathione lyase
MEMRLELVAVPVSDVDRAKAFYSEQVGFNVDTDQIPMEGLRFIQLTPPGSACSVAIGTCIVEAEPGSIGNLQLVVQSADAAREELSGRGVECSEVQEFPWGRFVYFSDPDGNRWSLQELPVRG